MQSGDYWQSQFLASALDQGALAAVRVNNNGVAAAAGAGAYLALANAVNARGVGLANANWNVLSTIAGVSLGYLVYKEQFEPRAMAGIALGIAALYLMNGRSVTDIQTL